MRFTALGAIVWLAIAGTAGAQAPDPQVMAPIQKFLDTFNKGDMAGAAATQLLDDDYAIIDEVPPHLWRGAKAFEAWGADLMADAKKKEMSEEVVTLGKPSRIIVEGDVAYVVTPATYTFKQKGAAMKEAAHMVFALKKGSSGWLIHGWTWTGTKPVAAKP